MDLIRIFKAIVTILMVILFITLLFSAYHHQNVVISTAGLVDATGTIANHLALDELAVRLGNLVLEYTVDPERVNSLEFCETVGGENFGYRLRIRSEGMDIEAGPPAQEGRETCSIVLPVCVFENFRRIPGKMEVVVWRA
jgi:hypothetical protein